MNALKWKWETCLGHALRMSRLAPLRRSIPQGDKTNILVRLPAHPHQRWRSVMSPGVERRVRAPECVRYCLAGHGGCATCQRPPHPCPQNGFAAPRPLLLGPPYVKSAAAGLRGQPSKLQSKLPVKDGGKAQRSVGQCCKCTHMALFCFPENITARVPGAKGNGKSCDHQPLAPRLASQVYRSSIPCLSAHRARPHIFIQSIRLLAAL
jgi:hypothetical protein